MTYYAYIKTGRGKSSLEQAGAYAGIILMPIISWRLPVSAPWFPWAIYMRICITTCGLQRPTAACSPTIPWADTGNISSTNGKIRPPLPVIRWSRYLKITKAWCGLARMGEDYAPSIPKQRHLLSLILRFPIRWSILLNKIRQEISGYPAMQGYLRLIRFLKLISDSLRLMMVCREISLWHVLL